MDAAIIMAPRMPRIVEMAIDLSKAVLLLTYVVILYSMSALLRPGKRPVDRFTKGNL